MLDHKRYAKMLKAALARANVERPLRPFHDGRHSSITNAAAAGTPPAALQARAGHSDYSTTQLYIDLAGETFREEAERLEKRLSRYEAEKTAVLRGGRPEAIDTFATSRENRARLR
ncbi:MAG: Phage integrase family [Gaiellaceae bacterium]|nr:Phage integrase family [Gaiellaceae bacterium]